MGYSLIWLINHIEHLILNQKQYTNKTNHLKEKFEEEKYIYIYIFFVNITINGSTFEFSIIDTCDTLNT